MSRRITIEDEDWGEYELFVLWESENGQWDDVEWSEIREIEEIQPLIELFSRVTWESYQDALNGNSMHLIRELGLPPEKCLIKGDIPVSKGFYHEECPAYDKAECFGHKSPPPCFSPTVEEVSFEVREIVSDIYEYWRNDVWIIIVEEDTLRNE
jgi:hypothetical protein